MHFVGDITLGSIAIIVTLIGIAISAGVRIGTVQAALKEQAAVSADHTMRLDRFEGRLLDLMSNVARLMGRIEAMQDRLEKTSGSRAGEGGRN